VDQTTAQPILPSPDLKRAAKLSAKAYARCSSLSGRAEPLTLSDIAMLAAWFVAETPSGSGVRLGAVTSSLQTLIGRLPSQELLHEVCAFLAHNTDRFAQGQPTFFGQPRSYLEDGLGLWSPLLICGVLNVQGVATLDLEVLWGPLYAVRFQRPAGDLRGLDILAKRLGLTNYRHRSYHPAEFTGCQLWAYIEMREYGGRQSYGFGRYMVTDAQVKLNKKLMTARHRECPFRYTHPCSACSRGWRQDPVEPCFRACREQGIIQESQE